MFWSGMSNAHELHLALTGHAHPGPTRAKQIPIRSDMAHNAIGFDTPGFGNTENFINPNHHSAQNISLDYQYLKQYWNFIKLEFKSTAGQLN